MELTGTYSPPLVVASYLVAVIASFAALNTAGRIAQSQGRAVWWWLGFGGLAMGTGIWSMHFIGMLAFRLPIPQGYDFALTLYSLLAAIAASGYALWLLSQQILTPLRLAGGALIMGAGIALMHYTGMASMRMRPAIEYRPGWFAASILIAVIAAWAALCIARRLRRETAGRRRSRFVAALVMGFAIIGMHYTGMVAARFPADSVCMAAFGSGGVSPDTLAMLVGVCSVVILGAAISITVVDRQLEERNLELSESLHGVNRRLTGMALHDPLTGLPNRLLLEERLDRQIATAAAEGSRFAVLFVDLDGFEGINDVHGHPAGDRLLVQAARGIQEAVRPEDTVARLGGDAFGVLAAVATGAEAAALAGAIAARLERAVDVGPGPARISASVGIALYPENGLSPRELLANADVAMYHVKEGGRNSRGFFDPQMASGTHARMDLIQDLRMACARGELFLVYQPKVDVADDALVGVEALVRWQHPQRGLLPPAAFIPLAEQDGTIAELGHWVLDEACRQLAEWRRAGLAVPNVAVNLSPVQFRSAGLVGQIQEILEREDLSPGDLALEITESMTLQDPGASLRILRRLVDLGVRISIDDFGTGHSSLDYFKLLPAHELKVDRSFVHGIRPGSRDAAIVGMMIGLGRNFGLDVVAEGVETGEERDALVGLGCTRMQGWLIGHPVRGEALAASLQARTDPA